MLFFGRLGNVRIANDDGLVAALTQQAIEESSAGDGQAAVPPPLVGGLKCPRCSLVSICLPDETTFCSQAESDDSSLPAQSYLFDIGQIAASR